MDSDQNNFQADVFFATRQLNCSALWNFHCNEGDSNQPVLENIHHISDESSSVTCVDVNPFIKGEFCELRRNHSLSISQRRLLSQVSSVTFLMTLIG